jgi:HK97 family phage major capsid protein
MNPRVKELYETQAAKQKELDGLLALEALSPEQKDRLKSLNTELKALDDDIAQAEERSEIETAAAARRERITKAVSTLPHAGNSRGGEDPPALDEKRLAPAIYRALRTSSVKNFEPREVMLADGSVKELSATEQAERFGMWFIAKFSRVDQGMRAKKYCEERGIGYEFLAPHLKVAYEGVNERGGYVVPIEFEPTLIDLRERYGVFRRYADVEPMGSDTKLIPRRVGGLTAYPVGEGQTITASDMLFDQVQLVAKKWAVLTKRSSELDEDNAINLGDKLIDEIAYIFSKTEDECGFNGDGTSTYHGITGVRAKILNLSATRANIAGLHVGSGNAWNELELTDFLTVLGRLPEYANTQNTAWYMSRSFFYGTVLRLILEQGGSPGAEVIAGTRAPMFLGYPVRFSQVMPRTEANDVIPVFFGDLKLATTFGDRRGTTIAVSEHSDFANDLLALRGTERFDIVVHDIGNESATAALREPGPIVGLATAAS